jgi:hypothetical protein
MKTAIRRGSPRLLRPRQGRVLLLLFGLAGVAGACLPSWDPRPPAMLHLDPARATVLELLAVPGVGLKRGREIDRWYTPGAGRAGTDPLATWWGRRVAPFLSISEDRTAEGGGD